MADIRSANTPQQNGRISTTVPDGTSVEHIVKTVTDGRQQLYAATQKHIYEYWWNASGSGSSAIVSANNIAGFTKSNDGSVQQVYFTDDRNVDEGYWPPVPLKISTLLPL